MRKKYGQYSDVGMVMPRLTGWAFKDPSLVRKLRGFIASFPKAAASLELNGSQPLARLFPCLSLHDTVFTSDSMQVISGIF